MSKRFMNIWFYRLGIDKAWLDQPELRQQPFVLTQRHHGRVLVFAACPAAQQSGIHAGMTVADARAICPGLHMVPDNPDDRLHLLQRLACASLRYTPIVAIDGLDSLLLDISGCAHLWGGEQAYLQHIDLTLQQAGYAACLAIADTIGAAWAVAHYGPQACIVPPGEQLEAIIDLPPAALRLEQTLVQRMDKLGMYQIRHFINIARAPLRRRFGVSLLERLDQALGAALEVIEPVLPVTPCQVRIPLLEPIRTAPAITMALEQLLEALCKQMEQQQIGLRTCVLRAWRVDGMVQQIAIATSRPSREKAHLAKLFSIKICLLEPDLGFEVMLLEAPVTEPLHAQQDNLWELQDKHMSEVAGLLDRLTIKLGVQAIHRYLPEAHHWPERSLRLAASLQEESSLPWQLTMPRPIHLLPRPEHIDVTVPRPDYPPVMFWYKSILRTIRKADGPERIAAEWWLDQRAFRDYYCVEDDTGCRYWVFRSGSYATEDPQWFIHGFFA